MMKDSVHRSLGVFFVFLFTILAGTIVLTLFFVLYETCMNLVAGEGAQFFDFSYFFKGFFISLPIILILSGFSMCCYLIKRGGDSKIPLIVYYVLYLAAWFAFIPLVFYTASKFNLQEKVLQKNVNISSGYFREKDGYIFYYSNVDENNFADGLVINLNGENQDVYTFKNLELNKEGGEFKDSLIEENIKLPLIVHFVTEGFAAVLRYVLAAMNCGWKTWLCFASVGLALASLAGVRKFSKWKLLNLMLETLFFCAILTFNIFVLSGRIFFDFNRNFTSALKFLPEGSSALLLCVNLLCFIAFLLLGIFSGIKNRKS